MGQDEKKHLGHRKRLLAKLKYGAMTDAEVLEALMYNAAPRVNTNDLAYRLISAFENIEGVLEASVNELMTVDGMGESLATYLKCVGVFCKNYYGKNIFPFPLQYNETDFFDFVRERYQGLPYEVLDVYFLSESGRVLERLRYTNLNDESVAFNGRTLAAVVAQSEATKLVFAHNHPSRRCSPSKPDINFTYEMLEYFEKFAVCVHDHLVCGRDGIFSFRQNGLMDRLRATPLTEELLETIFNEKNVQGKGREGEDSADGDEADA